MDSVIDIPKRMRIHHVAIDARVFLELLHSPFCLMGYVYIPISYSICWLYHSLFWCTISLFSHLLEPFAAPAILYATVLLTNKTTHSASRTKRRGWYLKMPTRASNWTNLTEMTYIFVGIFVYFIKKQHALHSCWGFLDSFAVSSWWLPK